MRTITRLLGLFIAVVCLSAAQGQDWLTNGLIAYYPFNGNANDASGNGYNLVNNGATYGPNHLEAQNSAVFFNSGSSHPPSSNGGNNFGGQWLSFGSVRPVDNLTALTISFWLKPGRFFTPAFGNAANEWILYQESVIMLTQNNYGPECFGFSVGNGIVGGWYPGLSVTNGTFGFSTNGVWVHCVYTVDASGQKLFANGILAQSNTNGVSRIGTNSYTLGLGAYYNGGIDNFRVYNRALSVSEVTQLYSIEAGLLNIHKAVYVDAALIVGLNYQLQASSDLINWTNQGEVFTATNSYWRPTSYWDVENWGQLYFRLKPQ